MEGDTLLVARAEFSVADPWHIPDAAQRVEFRRSSDGRRPRLRTIAALYRDDDFLSVVFSGEDDGVVATHMRHDAPLYEEDVMEVFIAPADANAYFEIEINPLATIFDAGISSPDGVRATMKTDLGWTCENVFGATRRTPSSWDSVLRIPFISIAASRPSTDDIWRANLFRIDRSGARGDEFTAWQPTGKSPADFHVVAAFGQLRFA